MPSEKLEIPEDLREMYKLASREPDDQGELWQSSEVAALIKRVARLEAENRGLRQKLESARRDAVEEAAKAICKFCRGEWKAQPAVFTGRYWVHPKNPGGLTGLVCVAEPIRMLAPPPQGQSNPHPSGPEHGCPYDYSNPETNRILTQEREHMSIGGTFGCPICGVAYPHGHTGEEIAEFKNSRAPSVPTEEGM
jgi:hypothetical protein